MAHAGRIFACCSGTVQGKRGQKPAGYGPVLFRELTGRFQDGKILHHADKKVKTILHRAKVFSTGQAGLKDACFTHKKDAPAAAESALRTGTRLIAGRAYALPPNGHAPYRRTGTRLTAKRARARNSDRRCRRRARRRGRLRLYRRSGWQYRPA